LAVSVDQDVLRNPMIPKIFRFLLAAALVAGIPTFSLAQISADLSRTANAVDTTSANRSVLLQQDVVNTPTSIQDQNTFAPMTPGDQDIGQQLILKRNDRAEPWKVTIDNNVFWTDNGANVHAGKIEDWFWVGGLNIGYQPQVSQRVYLDFNVGEHWFQYNRLTDLDFQSGEASAGVIVVVPELWSTIWYANYYYQRITQGLSYAPIYDTNDLRVGVQKTIFIDRLNSVNLGLQTAFAVAADPQALRRNEYTFTAGYNLKIMRELTLGVGYHLSYYDYFVVDRHDWFNNFSVQWVYQPYSWLEMALGYTFTVNRSNVDSFSYDTQLTGPSVSLKAKF